MIASEDYVRAEELLWPVLSAKIRNKSVSPNWLGESDMFWYRRDTPRGHEYVLVDPATGSKRPLFDPAALATLLKAQFDETGVSAEALALEDLAVSADLESFAFRLQGRAYRGRFDPLHCERRAIANVSRELSISPDGNWAVRTRDGKLLLRNMEGGVERVLRGDGAPDSGYGICSDTWKSSFIPRSRFTGSVPPFGLQWAPDSSRFIVMHVDQRHVAPYPFLESTPQDGSFRPKVHMARIPLVGERPSIQTWHVFDIPDGAYRKIEYPPDLHILQQMPREWWSGDCSHHFALAQGANLESAFLFDVDLATGRVRAVIEERLEPRTNLNGIVYNTPNVWLSDDKRESVWYSQRDGWGHLYLYDAIAGTLKRQITSGEWFVRDIIAVDHRKREILFTGCGREGGNPYYRSLYRVGFDGGEPLRLTREPWDHEIAPPGNAHVSPSGKYIVHASSTVDREPVSVVRGLSDGRTISVLEQADISAAVKAGYRPPQSFVVKAADGESDLYGVLYSPAGIDANGSYPIVVSQYTSPVGPASPKTFVRAMSGSAGPVTPAALTALGFAVMTLDPRGTSFRSRRFESAIDSRLNIIGMDDYAAAIEQLGKRHSWIDTGRVGIYGGSYGGYAVIRAMLEFPNVFKVGIASSPPAAIHNMYPDFHWFAYHGEPAYSDGSALRSGPADVPVNYRNVDANAQIERLKGRLLIIFGELDENVLPGSPLQFIARLIENDKAFDMVMLPNAHHGSVSRTHHFVRRHLDYFVEHLLGEKPPRDFRFTRLPQSPETFDEEGGW